MRRLLPVLLVVLALLGGCGGNDDDDAAAPATTEQSEPAPSTESAEQPGAEADARIAEEAGLVLEDFPSGWQQNDQEDDEEDSECPAVEEAKDATSARENSPQFSRGENTSAENGVYVYGDEAAATEAFAGLASPENRACLGEQVGKRASEAIEEESEPGPVGANQAEVGEVTTSRVSLDPVGDDSEAIRITIPISAQDIDVDLIADLVLVRVGRGIALFTFADVLTPFDEDLKADLTSTVVRRLTAGLG